MKLIRVWSERKNPQLPFFLLSAHILPPLREHRVQEGKVVFQLGVSVQGDIVVSVYHMRSTIGGRLQAKVESVYIFMPNLTHLKNQDYDYPQSK